MDMANGIEMYLNGRRETTRVLGGCNDKGVDVRLTKILEI